MHKYTRSILNFITDLHRGAILSHANKTERKAADAAEAIRDQQRIVQIEADRLVPLREAHAEACTVADATWTATQHELGTLVRRPAPPRDVKPQIIKKDQ